MKHGSFLTILYCIATLSASAQKIRNYDAGGNSKESALDYLNISLEPIGEKIPHASVVSAIGGPFIALGLDLINTIKKNRDLKFTASYANSCIQRFSGIPDLVNHHLMVSRIMMNNEKKAAADLPASEFQCSFSESHHMLTLSLDRFSFLYAKAKFSNTKDNLSLSISIEISAWLESDKKPTLTEVKLGETRFLIPLLKPGFTEDSIHYRYNNKGQFLSLILPTTDTGFFLSFKVTVMEVNASRLKPGLVSSLLTNNSSDVNDLLKAILNKSVPD